MFFFDDILELHINLSSLLVSSRVLHAAQTAKVPISWNDKGEVCRVSFTDEEALCRELDIKSIAVTLSLAYREPRMASPDFAEWLADYYHLSDNHQCFDSRDQLVDLPNARPAWFDLKDIDHRTPGHSGNTSAAMRSFVTSSGTCSLDLGIPTSA